MSKDRREAVRVPDSRLITEIVNERPNAASIVNVSGTGLFTVKPSARGARGPQIVQLEIPVPEASESVWALGEIVFERAGQSCVGAGIRFLAMADRHKNLIDEMVEYRRREILETMMKEIQKRKDLAGHPSPFASPPTALSEDTVRMYFMPRA